MLCQGFAEGIKPSENLDILTWMERNVQIPHSSRNPRFRRDTAPWLNDIFNATALDTNDEIVVAAPVGSGKTTFFECLIAWIVAQESGPTLVAGQTDETASAWAETRLTPVLKATASVAKLFPRDRHASRKTSVIFPHMPLFIGGANMSSLQEKSIRYCIADEVWRWKAGMVEELRRRTHDRWNSRVLLVSQAGEEGDDFHASEDLCNKYQWQWQCPKCQRRQPFHFKSLKYTYERRSDGSVDWDKLADSTRMTCGGCDAEFEDDAQVRRGLANSAQYIKVSDGMPARQAYNYNALTIWWLPWSKLVAEWVRAETAQKTGDNAPLRQFLQKRMAQRWERRDTRVSDQAVVGMRSTEYKRDQLIKTPAYISLCADPGQRETHWSVMAWTDEGESYVLDYGTVGDPEDLLKMLDTMSYQVNGQGPEHKIFCGLIDSGYWAEKVYSICARSDNRLFPSKGSTSAMGTIFRPSEIPNHPTLRLYRYSDFGVKVSLYVDKIQHRALPRMWFPADVGEDFMLGHMGQSQLKSSKTGLQVWKPVPNDHYGDCSKLHIVSWWAIRQSFEKDEAPPEEQAKT